MASINEIANELLASKEAITLIYAFNSIGKTKLSVEYKNITKKDDGKHSGVYYNAYSEDLFRWDNDEDHANENMRLEITQSSLNPYFSSIIESPEILTEKLGPYLPRYTYEFDKNQNPEIGIDAVRFSRGEETNIKISRGEERIFIWCFFLALFEADAWTGESDAHFFIDDPVSSLDDHNIYLTADSIINIINEKIADSKKRIFITTHHIGLFSILADRLRHSSYQNNFRRSILSIQDDELTLKNYNKDVFLYHLYLMQMLYKAKTDKALMGYHFVLLRQLLEIISSFLGAGGIKKALEELGYQDEELEMTHNRVNDLSHKLAKPEPVELKQEDADLLEELIEDIQETYNFITH